MSPGASPRSSAAAAESTTEPSATRLSGASDDPGSTPNAATLAALPPSTAARVIVMASGSADVTPGTSAHACHVAASTCESVNDTFSPSAGAANASRSARRSVMAEMF